MIRRYLRVLAFLRALYVALVGVSIGAAVGAVLQLLARNP